MGMEYGVWNMEMSQHVPLQVLNKGILIVLDIIYHLLKTQSRVGTRAILNTWISYGLYRPNTWTWVVSSQHLDCIVLYSQAGLRLYNPNQLQHYHM